MNTDPLPSLPLEQNSNLSAKTSREHERSWRELILRREVESIWNRLARLTRSQSDSEWDLGDRTQDLFLRLLSGGQFNTYVDENWSEEQITLDLISVLQCQFEA
jgi:hypothetical protein